MDLFAFLQEVRRSVPERVSVSFTTSDHMDMEHRLGRLEVQAIAEPGFRTYACIITEREANIEGSAYSEALLLDIQRHFQQDRTRIAQQQEREG